MRILNNKLSAGHDKFLHLMLRFEQRGVEKARLRTERGICNLRGGCFRGNKKAASRYGRFFKA